MIQLPKVAILLCTHNGGDYLKDQLATIALQKFVNWKIFASDDGSKDTTVELLKEFQRKYGTNRIEIYDGPCKGPTSNFLYILSKAIGSCDYFAFCDQDDRWNADKLMVAIKSLDSLNNEAPTLYCGATKYISADGKFLQNSYVFQKPPSFGNALVQSIAGGNTMVFNYASAKLLARTPVDQRLIAHDWWLYILVSAHEGVIVYDQNSYVDYRQHNNTLIGENRSIEAKITRIKKLIDGRYKNWNDENLRVLYAFYDEINDANKSTLNFYTNIKYGNIIQRIYGFIRSSIRRQTFIGNLALIIAAIFKKI